MWKKILKILFYIFIFLLLMSISTVIHEVGHAIITVLVGGEVARFELDGFLIFFLGGRCQSLNMPKWSYPFICAGGLIFAGMFGFLCYIYARKRKTQYMAFIAYLLLYKELFYAGLSPFINYGDFRNIIWFFKFHDMYIAIILMYSISINLLCLCFSLSMIHGFYMSDWFKISKNLKMIIIINLIL